MNKVPLLLLLTAAAGTLRASVIETISFDLSSLHPGSTLSGTFTLPNSPVAGDTAPVLLTFSDPQDYSPTSINATISIGSGTFLAFTVGFSDILFTNPGGNVFTKNNDLMPRGLAQCASFPCSTTGGFEDNNPPAFTSTYSVTAAAIPEPAFGFFCAGLLGVSAFARRFVVRG